MAGALTNHADFEGTLEHIKTTGARFVLTDDSRGGHAVEFAEQMKHQLGIGAAPSLLEPTDEWGV